MYKRLVLLALALGICASPIARAANIIWVAEATDINSDGTPDDFAWIPWLEDLGHTVDVQRGYWMTLDAAKIEALNAADLVIISRCTGSGSYNQDATEISQWSGITAPMLNLSAYFVRNSRWFWVNSATVNNLVGPAMEVVAPEHPIFAGIDTSGPVAVVDGTTGSGQTSVIGTVDVGNGTLLARTGANAWIVEWEPGQPFYAGSSETPGGKRLLFSAGTQEVSPTPIGAFNLTEDGQQMLINAMNYLMGITTQVTASAPVPAHEATDVPRDAVLSWTASKFAATHDVYFGDSFDAVSNADAANPMDVLVSQGQSETAFDPAGTLELGQVYYWRVDEVNGAPDFAVSKGDVWSFTVEPVSYPIQNVTATASSSNAGMGPENTVNGSGMNANDEHSTEPMEMWLSAQGAEQPTWIQYEFDNVYKLDKLLAWNSNQMLESILGFGAKDVTVEYSLDGTEWTALGDFEFPRASGSPTYVGDVAVDLAGAVAKYVRLTINSNWGGIVAQYGLAEVRFFSIPVLPREPMPAAEATNVEVDAVLSWRAGREAASHVVYFGEDANAVANGTAPAQSVTTSTFDPGPLEFGKTYFWKVIEVNDAAAPSEWQGDLWSFTTREYLIVDDMESYDDKDNRIYDTWVDGWVNNTGSQIGYEVSPFAEKSIVHGGKQSMPSLYNNEDAPFYSEAEREFSATQDWTVNGADTLSLWVRGYPAAFVEDAGTITMSGGGHDIWDNADDFRYAYKTLNGNGSIVVKVESLLNTNAWAKAGLMIRQNLEADSKFVYMIVSYAQGVSMGWRPLPAGTCSSVTQAGVASPQWVKLTRTGDVFTAQYSADGATWTDLKNADGTVASTTVAMSNPAYIGLCVTSHDAALTTVAVMSGAAVTGSVTGAAWEVKAIGDDPQVTNSAEDLYVTIADSAGKTATVMNPTAINSADWTQWKIPLSDLAGVNLSRVKKMTVGVGSRTSPVTGGAGTFYLDDIGFGKAAQ